MVIRENHGERIWGKEAGKERALNRNGMVVARKGVIKKRIRG